MPASPPPGLLAFEHARLRDARTAAEPTTWTLECRDCDTTWVHDARSGGCWLCGEQVHGPTSDRERQHLAAVRLARITRQAAPTAD